MWGVSEKYSIESKLIGLSGQLIFIQNSKTYDIMHVNSPQLCIGMNSILIIKRIHPT